ncbi:hypothetical protein CI109_102499 [Kwoniella shandongensis]|uniref:Membrane insertase YidC/Oxa/ALB C-terminal domain-containing protein n=1 Tax=Kwoniella shandongensis TaxID=1734106 RepID=A0A5M6C475_9TREE|nr:uncharacterized protein CI109_003183 [Kwoniella shandongensis]KAA5528285.1 hypothetical protein CI109_003183 [Kwoniella shandongensis]
MLKTRTLLRGAGVGAGPSLLTGAASVSATSSTVRYLSSSSFASSSRAQILRPSPLLAKTSRPRALASLGNSRRPMSNVLGGPRYLSTTPLASSPLESSTSTSSLDALDPALLSTPADDLVPVSSFLDPIVNPLSDLLLHQLPHPLGYGTTIILLTLLVRTTITLPISIWQRKRALRAQRLVQPELKAINERLAISLRDEFRKRGASYNQYLTELRRQLAIAHKALNKKHQTHPFITTWSPLLIHIPIFVTLSLTIRKALELPGSAMASEHLWWLEKLGEADPYGILPLVGMGVAFGNAELVGLRAKEVRGAFKGPEQEAETPTKSEAVTPELSAPPPTTPKPVRPTHNDNAPATGLFNSKSKTTTTPPPRSSRRISTTSSALLASQPSPRTPRSQPASRAGRNPDLVEVGANDKPPTFSPARQAELRRSFFAGVLRFSALGFGMIASQMPSGVVLYWFTSLCFSFVQNVLMSWLPQRRLAKAREKAAAEAQASASASASA